jgi:hypothetical protein
MGTGRKKKNIQKQTANADRGKTNFYVIRHEYIFPADELKLNTTRWKKWHQSVASSLNLFLVIPHSDVFIVEDYSLLKHDAVYSGGY